MSAYWRPIILPLIAGWRAVPGGGSGGGGGNGGAASHFAGSHVASSDFESSDFESVKLHGEHRQRQPELAQFPGAGVVAMVVAATIRGRLRRRFQGVAPVLLAGLNRRGG
jgi:hypothetical protein